VLSEAKAQLLAAARESNKDYRQYDRKLTDENCSVAIGRVRKSPRGQVWFEKNETVLVIGGPQWRTDIGKAEWFHTIWSRHCKSFCLTPSRTLTFEYKRINNDVSRKQSNPRVA
jgi:hypothetical protein